MPDDEKDALPFNMPSLLQSMTPMIGYGSYCEHFSGDSLWRAPELPCTSLTKYNNVTGMAKRKAEYLRCTPKATLFRAESVEHRNNVVLHAASKWDIHHISTGIPRSICHTT